MSSPSGAGKTSISKMLLKKDKLLSLSISCTTRPIRKGEVNKKDYIFFKCWKCKKTHYVLKEDSKDCVEFLEKNKYDKEYGISVFCL